MFKRIQNLCIKKGLRVAVAESCTGGLLSKIITDIPGSSEYFWGSIVCYSNEAKMKFLKVKKDSLEIYGAVSRQVAIEMVEGISNISKADINIAITGIAGPGGGTEGKPVGTVFVAIKYKKSIKIFHLKFKGSRKSIRKKTAKFVSKKLLDILK
jgi:PncC family amidohydrolase